MRRLFSTFAHGPPGVGLLLIRLAAGGGLIVHGITELRNGAPPVTAGLDAFVAALGLLLLAGLWTPIAGALVAVTLLWCAYAHAADPGYCIMVATLGAALALLGPGAFSVDARLFGWKRLEIRDRKSHIPPPG